nr:hypothetical protein [Bacteroidota bacterium]
VPYPFKLGYSFNYGNPRALKLFSWTILLVLVCLILIPAAAPFQYISQYPGLLWWILFSCLSAMLILFLNPSDRSRICKALPYFSFGFLPAAIGFGGQSIINGPLFSWIGAENIVWTHHLIFAPVAALSQTAGKILIILFILRIFDKLNFDTYIIYSLMLGCGFAITEIVSIRLDLLQLASPIKNISS